VSAADSQFAGTGAGVTVRPALATLPAYVPGRTVPGAIKLASNETAYPLLPAVAQRVAEALGSSNRYPDLDSVALRTRLAARLDVAVDQLVVGCGSVALCQQVVQVMAGPGDEVLYPWRSFEAYPILTTVAGADSVQVPLRPDQSFDLDALAAAVTPHTRVMFVCSPNNPTGTVVRRADLETLLDRVPSRVLVVLDEAYREFVTDADVPDGTDYLDRPNVLVLRTFSKAYGLAGLRVGYGIAADPALARALRQVQIPFAVSTIAQEAALACLEPDAEQQLMQRVDEVVAERSRVYDALVDLGYPVVPSQANFVWIPLGDETTEWARRCEEHGVIVRPFAGVGARVTIGTAAENDTFVAAAAAGP
jgi:histidinol-phosphate aminotransferase